MNESQQDRATTRVMRPYTLLPPRRAWPATDRAPYVAVLPDALAGLLRQFTSHALDLGRLLGTDDARYAVYRSQVFDARDRLLAQLDDWLAFWELTEPDGRLRCEVAEILAEGVRCVA